MTKRDISKEYDRCGGTGFEGGNDPISGDPVQVQCPKCVGTGLLSIGVLEEELIDDIVDIKDKVNDINENLDETKDKVDWIKTNMGGILDHLGIQEQ